MRFYVTLVLAAFCLTMVSLLTSTGVLTMMPFQARGLRGLVVTTANRRTVMVGDSVLASDHKIQRFLEEKAGHSLENYAVIGASIHEGWVASVRDQYDAVNQTPAIHTMIVNGGGNDVMSHRDDCVAFTDTCRDVLEDSIAMVDELVTRMEADGVAHILYLGFYRVPGLEKAADYASTRLQERLGKKEKCVFVDLRNVSVPLAWDGLHPTDEGYATIGLTIWDVAAEHKVPI